MEVHLKHEICRESICHPRQIKKHPDGKVSSWQTIDWRSGGGYVMEVQVHEITDVCIDEGSYFEPPVWEIEYLSTLVIKPIYKCWGKGVSHD